MLKNMQMKKEIYENEMKIADYRRSKEKAPVLEKVVRKAQETTPIMEKMSSKTSMETPIKSHVETIEIDVDHEHRSIQKQANGAQNILKALNNAVSLTPPIMVRNQVKKVSPEIEIASPKRPLTDSFQNRSKNTHYPDEPALKRAKADENEIMMAPKVTVIPKKNVAPIESTPLDADGSPNDLNSTHQTTFGFDISASNSKQVIPESSPNDFLRTLFNQSDEGGKVSDKESFFNPFGGDQLSTNEPENGSGQAPNGFDFFGTLGGGQDNAVPDNGFTFSFNMNAADSDSQNGQAAGGFPMFNF
uniref:Uncharacterized protein n=1 Tax=Romanomermis culicivorax TaxID=13658 RepID=A0A915HH56_ROMCU